MRVHTFSLSPPLPIPFLNPSPPSLLPSLIPPQGGFAHCYELIDVDTNKVFAGKIVPKSLLVKPHQKDKVKFITYPVPLFPTPVYHLPISFPPSLLLPLLSSSPLPTCLSLSFSFSSSLFSFLPLYLVFPPSPDFLTLDLCICTFTSTHSSPSPLLLSIAYVSLSFLPPSPGFLTFYLICAFVHLQAHTHTYTHAHNHIHSHSHTLALTYTHPHTYTPTHSHTTHTQMTMEIDIHRNLSHTHIVGFHGFFEDKNHVYILLELCRRR